MHNTSEVRTQHHIEKSKPSLSSLYFRFTSMLRQKVARTNTSCSPSQIKHCDRDLRKYYRPLTWTHPQTSGPGLRSTLIGKSSVARSRTRKRCKSSYPRGQCRRTIIDPCNQMTDLRRGQYLLDNDIPTLLELECNGAKWTLAASIATQTAKGLGHCGLKCIHSVILAEQMLIPACVCI